MIGVPPVPLNAFFDSGCHWSRSHVRSTLLQLPFGDQGLALPAATLAKLGGWGGRAYP
eukprot:COSAG01_NODE_57700_length_310_cov_1.587678_1_plen_57_part_01